MDSFFSLLSGFEIAFTWQNILLVLLGCFFGTVIGMLPGIGPINAIAILFPIMFALEIDATSAIITFAGIYYGAMYGNSISSILLNIPGTSSSAVTAIDGYELAKQNKGGKALSMSAWASFIGGTLSIFLLVIFAPVLASFAISFGPSEYFVLMIFAFLTLTAFSEGGIFKAMLSALLGISLSTIGLDPLTGEPRFTFGVNEMMDGIDFSVVVIGMFAISELFNVFLTYAQEKSEKIDSSIKKIHSIALSWVEMKKSIGGILRSCFGGFIVGVLPGAGGTIASFLAYTTEKKINNKDKTFGKGDLRGVAAPESANNSAAVGSFIPLLILGVPGSETTAIMLAGLVSLGITPGPLLLTDNPQVFWGLAASMFLGNLFLIILNLPLIKIFIKILSLPKSVLMSIIVILSIVGVYSVSGSVSDLYLMIIFGVLGFLMKKMSFPLAPLILGMVLGKLIENNFSRALLYNHGDYSVFFNSPMTIVLWILIALSLFAPSLLRRYKKQK